MPQLDYTAQTTVFYLFGKDPRTGQLKGPAGTGVFVGREGANTRHVYAVTAYHVAVYPHGISQIRINTAGRDETGREYLSSRLIELEPEEWNFIANGDDLAAVDVTDKLHSTCETDFVSCVGEDEFATEEFIEKLELTEGEDGFMLGLFTPNSGGEVNVPAIRFGNIAQMAHDALLIEQGNHVKRPSHVFDMRSRPGFSGSPVFVYRTPDHDLRGVPELGSGDPLVRLVHPENLFICLLGVHSGQFQEEITVEKAEAYGKLAIHEGDKLIVPSSMTIVVPAWRISDLLNLPQFEELREMREKRIANEN